MWLPEVPTENPNSHIMMVFALSASVRASSTWRAANVAHCSVLKSMGFLLLGFTAASASIKLSMGLLLHSASSAKPKGANASPYMTCPPDLPTEYPNNHIMVLIGSGVGVGAPGPTSSFWYFAQFIVARLISAALLLPPQRHRNNRQPPRSFIAGPRTLIALNLGMATPAPPAA
jgi:hypothetical protein